MKRRLGLTLFGLIAIALLWAPMPTTVAMSFSGPTQAVRTFGLVPYLRIATDYKPSRVGFALQDASGKVHRSEPPQGPLHIGEYPRLTEETRDRSLIWERSETQVVLIRPTSEAVVWNTLALSLAGALTVIILGSLAWQWRRARRVGMV